MKPMIVISACAVAALFASASDPAGLEGDAPPAETSATDAASAQPEETLTGAAVSPQKLERSIDWEAARAARIAAIDAGKKVDDEGLVQAQSGGIGSPVPVMLPSGIIVPANQKQIVKMTKDGYFASYPGAKYDIVVNGTNEVFETRGTSVDDAGTMKFTPMEAGAQVAFSRFGADYLVEFECNIIDGEESCVTEEEALKVAEELFVAATQ